MHQDKPKDTLDERFSHEVEALAEDIAQQMRQNKSAQTSQPKRIDIPQGAAPIINKMIGRELHARDAVFSIEQDSQTGDVHVRDIAGNNIYHVHYQKNPNLRYLLYGAIIFAIAIGVYIVIFQRSFSQGEQAQYEKLMPTVIALETTVALQRDNAPLALDLKKLTAFDFEQDDDLQYISPTLRSSVQRSNNVAFLGKSALAITTSQDVQEKAGGGDEYVQWNYSFRASALVGQIYFPLQPGVNVYWAQACLVRWQLCIPIDLEPGKWNTFIFDFRNFQLENSPLSERDLWGMYLRAGISLEETEQPYTFYIDSIHLYPAQNK